MRSLFIVCLMLLCLQMQAADIYVSVNGSDRNPGTSQQPLATVNMALRKARDLRRLQDASIAGGIRIIVGQGTYFFTEPLFIRPEDSGTEASPTTIEAAPGEVPVFSGGMQIKGWRRSKGKMWVASLTAPLQDFRQLWVNGVKAVRAREYDADSMARIISWNHADESCVIPVQKGFDASAPSMEMVIHQWWAIANLRIRSVQMLGDSARLRFHQPESRVQSEHPWPAPWISRETGNSAFYLTNALQFLDQPGEWYLDKKQQLLYYYPRQGENMQSASVMAPYLETLVRMEGSADHPVSHVHFKGISLQHTGWLRPSEQGHVPHQAGMYMLDAYKLKVPGTPDKQSLENQAWVGRPDAAVEAAHTRNTSFEQCRFEHMASTGLDYAKGNHNDKIRGNLFKDIGGTAILLGTFSDEATEVHLPYNPSDEREISTGTLVGNNLITDVTNEDWGCVGIGAGYVRNVTIEHNDISEISYSGISLGWGWTRSINALRNNKVIANKIHHYAKHMYDVAGIYTLSAQPGTLISRNYIDSIYVAPYAHIPLHWFYLYTDEGTSFVTVSNNWCPSEKFLKNANGPGNTWENNGPQVADSIKRAAGLQPAYRHLLREKASGTNRRINHQQPAIIEIIAGQNRIDTTHLLNILQEQGIHRSALYRWKDRYAVFSMMQDPGVVRSRLQQAFEKALFKVYDNPFYEFNRSRCNDTATTRQWDHVLLTADLVNDPKLQQEYMDHHATQFEKWPELSRGFCNASFQQLLIYRNQQQLMLVISIPKGESLDKLNPRTTENNPRADAWNALMKKYQQGIAGTAQNEVWVFLQPLYH